MRAISKSVEPKSLARHRTRAHSTYANLSASDAQDLREALVQEQGGLCCYCMGPIGAAPGGMKIEHWRCQSNPAHARFQLKYSNLLGACLGGQGKAPNQQHCDTRKGSKSLKWNPATPSHAIEARVRYEPDGSIRSNDRAFNSQLDDVLNLNLAVLKASRKGILAEIAAWWRREKDRRHGPVPKAVIAGKLAKVTDSGPYCGVATWALRQRLAKAA